MIVTVQESTARYDLDQRRCDQQNAIADELFTEGFTDGVSLSRPRRTDEPYILGYAEGLRQLRRQGYSLLISDAFLQGGYDNPNPCSCDEL